MVVECPGVRFVAKMRLKFELGGTVWAAAGRGGSFIDSRQ